MKNITIAGNIGKDAAVRTTQQGDKVAGFSVAVEDGFGQNKRTIWFDVSIWGQRAEKLAPYLTKGAKVAVAGDLSTREHDGKTYLTVRASEITLQGRKPDGQRGDDRQSGGRDNQSTGYGAGGHAMDDEIPFAPEVRA